MTHVTSMCQDDISSTSLFSLVYNPEKMDSFPPNFLYDALNFFQDKFNIFFLMNKYCIPKKKKKIIKQFTTFQNLAANLQGYNREIERQKIDK